MTTTDLTLDTVTLERDRHVLVMGLNRPDKRNAFNFAEGVQSSSSAGPPDSAAPERWSGLGFEAQVDG